MWVRDWSARHLFAAWAAYWAVLLGVVAWRPVAEYWRLQRSDAHGQVSLSFDGSFLSLALWLAGPPLLLFVAWLVLRSRKRAAGSGTRAAP